MLRVIGYVRASTDDQALTLEVQRGRVAAYCVAQGLDLVELIEDAGASGKTLARPGLARVLATLASGGADGLVVAKLDRLSRSVRDWQDLITSHFGEGSGRHLFSVADSIDTTTAAGRLVLNVILSVAQWEREVIVERTRDALAELRSQGRRTGGVPYGWVLADDGTTLVADPAEQAGIVRLRELHATGISYRAIARSLDAEGIPTKGGGTWGHQAVARILQSRSRP